MRKLLVAALIALSAPLAAGQAAEAATKVIVKQMDHRPHHRVVETRRIVRDHDRRDMRDHDRRYMRDHDRGCFTKKVVTRVHGERMVKMTKICR